MNSSIQKWGNSGAIRLPKAILEIAHLSENEAVHISAQEGEIIIKKLEKPKHKTLKERLANYDGNYVAEERDLN